MEAGGPAGAPASLSLSLTPPFPSPASLFPRGRPGVVHITGGAAALMGAWVTGPRIGRFTPDGHLVDLPACNPAQVALGVFILWFSWYGFNPGSTQCVYGCMQLAARVGVNTTLGAGAGGLSALLLATLAGSPGDIGPILNGILAGELSFQISKRRARGSLLPAWQRVCPGNHPGGRRGLQPRGAVQGCA